MPKYFTFGVLISITLLLTFHLFVAGHLKWLSYRLTSCPAAVP